MDNRSCDDNMESAAEKELAEILNESQMDSNIDIDTLLNDKAKKNQLTKPNVKNLIKNVLMNEDVVTMLRQTLADDGDGNCLYEPKLTRGKIKEMLKSYPPSVHQWTSNQQNSMISECRLLIEKEFPDDSEDEEYCPDKNLEDDEEEEYDDEESKFSEINKSFETDGEIENDNNSVLSINDKETIGMRTRSKFSLNDTPLETIEQAFIPPDITEDMYNSSCENDEWMEFLSEFTKPLESVQNDDADEDSEYNVLSDDELTNVDKEEFRIDKSVKITRKEYNDLMDELYEFTETYNVFNGVETLNTDTDNTKNTNDKIVAKPKNNSNLKSSSNCPANDVLQITEGVSYSSQLEKQISISLFNKVQQNTTDQFEKINYALPSTSFKTHVSNLMPTENGNTVVPSLISQNTVNCQEDDISLLNNVQQNTTEQFQKINNTLPSTSIKIRVLNLTPLKNISDENTVIPSLISQNKTDNCQECGMTSKQMILFKQQLTQHIQLITQTYLLSTMAKPLKKNCKKLKMMLEAIRNKTNNKVFMPINIHTSLKFIEDWNEVFSPKYEIDAYDEFVILPSDVKEFILFYDKPVFVYPEMLPIRTYRLNPPTHSLGSSEEKLLVFKMNYIYKKLKESPSTRVQYKNKNLSDLMPLIIKTVHRRWFSHRRLADLKHYITRRMNSLETSSIRNYILHNKIDQVIHVVDLGALVDGKPLYEYNFKKFPIIWKSLIKKLELQNKFNHKK